jgi:DNA polymerase-3 subunit alpha
MVVGYVTAWLKFYYPVEFMAALMSSVQGTQKKIAMYINHCREDLGIEVLPPDINIGEERFIPTKDGKIIFSLNAKGVSENFLTNLKKVRGEGFTSFEDFMLRCFNFVGKADIAALACSGAFLSLGVNRAQISAASADIADKVSKAKQARKRAEVSGRPFDLEMWLNINSLIPDIGEYPDKVVWALEQEYLGIFLTGHPIHEYMYQVAKYTDFKLEWMDYEVDPDTGLITFSSGIKSRRPVCFVGMFKDVKITATRKKKEAMAIVQIEDLTSSAKMMIWPDSYAKYRADIEEGNVMIIRAETKVESDEPPVLIFKSAEPLSKVVLKKYQISSDDPLKVALAARSLRDGRVFKETLPVSARVGRLKLLLPNNCWSGENELSVVAEKIGVEITEVSDC